MEYRKPNYYDEFSCIAGECPETCCAGWDIVIDDKSMENYKNIGGNLGKYVMNCINQQEGVFKRNGARCAFLNNDNLCDLYIKAGENQLCKTCRRYPRHFEIYGDLIEGALSMSCPEAARLILNNTKNSYKIKKNDKKSANSKEIDRELLETLLLVRKKMFSFIEKATSLKEAILGVLLFADMLQPIMYDLGKIGNKVKYKLTSRKLIMLIGECEIPDVTAFLMTEDIEARYARMSQYFDLLLGLENINENWPILVNKVEDKLYRKSDCTKYKEYAQRFSSFEFTNLKKFKNIFSYFLYTYFLGGIYDNNILAMVKLSVLSTLYIREIAMAWYLENDNMLSMDEFIKVCYTYSRQMEHSDDNLLAFEGILTAHPVFMSENIIKVV